MKTRRAGKIAGHFLRVTLGQHYTTTRFFRPNQINRSHAIHILSIQIDIRVLEMLRYNQVKNIKMSFYASHMKQSFSALILINES